jgi:Na+-translocating ferredoxin:NAD+ oxidoreductase RnfD subunit
VTSRTLALGGERYPLVLPSVRDPRLHVAAVIITIHVLGQLLLHFQVTVPQILAAILTCAVLEIAITFAQTRTFVWPASAMLTGSGVALILRVVGTPVDDHWSLYGTEIFAVVAGLSLLTKYVIRYRGTHVFNPSNIGLVVTFVVLGASRVEPLDFWWAPLGLGMVATYAVILGGGLLITRRLRLLGLAASFWLILAAGLGVLAASGHCMTTSWSFTPVCGVDYVRVIVTSPEVLVFLFFMITDPRTVPAGRVGRVAFGLLVGLASVLLMAPQTDEFGTKVGLLAGLAAISALWPLLNRFVPAPKSAGDDLRQFARRLMPAYGREGLPRRLTGATAALGIALFLAAAVVVAGIPARGPSVVDATELLNDPPVNVDPSRLPPITVANDVIDFDHTLAGEGLHAVILTLAQNLELENQALLRVDEGLLAKVDHGDRLIQMQARMADAAATGTTVVQHYRFDSIDVSLLVPFGVQSGLSLGMAGTGIITEETLVHGVLQERGEAPFDLVFALRRATGARWLNVAVNPRTLQ